ncbi:MAG: hypothetical protein N2Z23_07280 [Pyrinomonadaceae bacterium]|nr:hypothetical protein [Pyrinomonadaceae bacterium]MCX7640227.1 hypothetical protein [Pyrinomonadaceae bacterium]MDW8303928.1 hypothetical protein [Acidobacteriota bacterium]
MKICPLCNRRYEDEMNFCVYDRGALVSIDISSAAFSSDARTVGEPVGDSWKETGKKKGSKAWLWVLGVFAGVALICSGGFIVLLGLLASLPVEENNSSDFARELDTIDISQYKKALKDSLIDWVPARSIEGTEVTYSNNELVMKGKKDFYYVLITQKSNFRTENALTRVVVRNVTGKETKHGFGILIHSDPKRPLQRDYAFLIDTSSQKFRVVRHRDGQEETLVPWSKSDAIKPGIAENLLEVVDENGNMKFYVNRKILTSYSDDVGIKKGVVGIYVSDDLPIAFSGLEIRTK